MAKLNPYRFILFLALWLLAGCRDNYASVSFDKVESERAKLINGIESYQSIDEFKGYLNHSSLPMGRKQKPAFS